MIVNPKVRGFICTTAHPTGCAAHTLEQINYVKSQKKINGPKNVLVIGASTGYGLASRIVSAFGAGAATIGVFFEKPASESRTGSAGWYNTVAFEKAAQESGLYAKSINGDAFSNEIKNQAIEIIKNDLGKIDLVVYSLASPRRVHPDTGETFNSVIKPIGNPYTNKTVNFHSGEVSDITVEPANDEEARQTVAVMGGEDWEMWMKALKAADVLADNVITVAYSYIGPDITHPIYKDGTIGRAKDHLDATVTSIDDQLKNINGKAYVSVNKALVTQASSAIPIVPLYISLLYKVMKNMNLHEGCIEQIYRLVADRLYSGSTPELDEKGRIRIDDWEMREDVQAQIPQLWSDVTTENLETISDITGYRKEFFKLFGFGLEGVDYEKDVEINLEVPSIK
jgi:enoyl-[acyl-carrier protein] reductase / trans-2-enoyl-CoA reductase (NAD+)